jgi:hypothetical protein
MALERAELSGFEVFVAQSLGFIWRKDKQPIMEVFNVIEMKLALQELRED